MKKDFQEWHDKKSKIDDIEKRPFFHEREVWNCHLGVNVGFEQDGGQDFLRPILVLKKFSNESFWGIPLTKSTKGLEKSAARYYFAFSFIEGIQSVAILSQMKFIDAKRLSYKIGEVSEKDFEKLKEKLKVILP